MKRLHIRRGVIIGLAISLIISLARESISASRVQHQPDAAGALLADEAGALDEIVMHYVPSAGATVQQTYRDFLTQLPEAVTVHIVCPDRAAFADLRRRVGTTDCRWVAVLTGHPMTTWSRDRWLALAPHNSADPITLLSPAEEDGAALWLARAGDARTSSDLARQQPERIRAIRSSLYFDGGDFVADETTAFVTPRVIERNVGRTVNSREELSHELGRMLKRKIVFLKNSPPHHAGMFMMLIGNGTVLVGDPAAAKRLAEASSATRLQPLLSADFSAATQKRFDAVAEQCDALGYSVVRMPVVPGVDGRTYLTSLNVILDQRGERRTVYMPVYAGVCRSRMAERRG